MGVARVTLRQVLEDVEIGAALGHNRAYHYADIFGADGKRVGRVRYGFTFRRPLEGLLKEYRLQVGTFAASPQQMAHTRHSSEQPIPNPPHLAISNSLHHLAFPSSGAQQASI